MQQGRLKKRKSRKIILKIANGLAKTIGDHLGGWGGSPLLAGLGKHIKETSVENCLHRVRQDYLLGYLQALFSSML